MEKVLHHSQMAHEHLVMKWQYLFEQLGKNGTVTPLPEKLWKLPPSSKYDSSDEGGTYEFDEKEEEEVQQLLELFSPVDLDTTEADRDLMEEIRSSPRVEAQLSQPGVSLTANTPVTQRHS